MERREKPIFLKGIIVIFGILLVEAGLLLYFFPVPSISGNSIADLTKLYSDINPTSKMFLLVQWALIGFILIVIFFKNKGIWRRNSEKEGIQIDAIMKKSKTNLDALYTVLQEKKQLSIRSVCDLFTIKEDLAMEWARILEAGELASIEYPGIGSPVLVIKEKDVVSKNKGEKSSKSDAKDKDVKQTKKAVITHKKQAKKQVNKLIKNLKKEHKKLKKAKK